jgi:DNA-binding LytR/AlgR family response regulator
MTCFIVDDEPLAHKVLENYIAQLDNLQLVGNAYKAAEAINFLQKNEVDILFLDIEMPELTGLEMLKTLQNPPNVILTTAYSEFALEGYELGVVDYLLKPIRFDRFVKAVQRITIAKKISVENDYFFAKADGVQHRINFADIRFIEAFGNYVKIHLVDKFILTAETMTGIQTKIPLPNFVRVHKSFIINIDKVERIDGSYISVGKNQMPIGASYKANLMQILNL